ncbi:MAG TPA: hypothetical protein VK897_18745 [Anaerolineales bacterium]|nr:hypothetical protein [Anaerolineales bacterium]
MITQLRDDLNKIDQPQVKALFDVSAEVLGNLQKAFERYESPSEQARR